MKLTFAGTKGYIDLRSSQHLRHSCLLVQHRSHTVLLDCGEDWLGHLDLLGSPEAIVVTHAHPDHAGGLKNGWDGPVWASADTWAAMARFPIQDRRVLAPGTETFIAGMSFTSFPLVHSIRAPAVGLRVRAERTNIFYVPDVLWIENRGDALAGVDLYIGDGAMVRRDLVRKRDDIFFGHASMRRQIEWCANAGIKKAVFTHCGSGVVRDHDAAAAAVRAFGQALNVQASIATDGLVLVVKS